MFRRIAAIVLCATFCCMLMRVGAAFQVSSHQWFDADTIVAFGVADGASISHFQVPNVRTELELLRFSVILDELDLDRGSIDADLVEEYVRLSSGRTSAKLRSDEIESVKEDILRNLGERSTRSLRRIHNLLTLRRWGLKRLVSERLDSHEIRVISVPDKSSELDEWRASFQNGHAAWKEAAAEISDLVQRDLSGFEHPFWADMAIHWLHSPDEYENKLADSDFDECKSRFSQTTQFVMTFDGNWSRQVFKSDDVFASSFDYFLTTINRNCSITHWISWKRGEIGLSS